MQQDNPFTDDLPLEDAIRRIEEKVTAKVAEEAPESVFVEGYGTFYRRGTGWFGPGGNYGPGTEGARMCEEALALNKQKGG